MEHLIFFMSFLTTNILAAILGFGLYRCLESLGHSYVFSNKNIPTSSIYAFDVFRSSFPILTTFTLVLLIPSGLNVAVDYIHDLFYNMPEVTLILIVSGCLSASCENIIEHRSLIKTSNGSV